MAKFQKGQSGNPGGRPRVIGELRELARQHAPDAISTLVAVMKNTKLPPAARVSAATAILDRGYGKPVQALDHGFDSKENLDGGEVRILVAFGKDEDAQPLIPQKINGATTQR